MFAGVLCGLVGMCFGALDMLGGEHGSRVNGLAARLRDMVYVANEK